VKGIIGETAVIGLVAGNIMWPSLLGALFLTRIWKVSTATKPKEPQQQVPEATAQAPAPAQPAPRAVA
jgi:hypothetical protein